MFNLAAIRYRNVMAAKGGPVAQLETVDGAVLGHRQFVTNATLVPGLGDTGERAVVFSAAHGSGTASSPMVARFMAISEALERWAHWQLHRGDRAWRFGFDADPSSNGMAAFPGVLARQARSRAVFEAAERFNLMHWWEGRLAAREVAAPWPGVRAAVICSDAPGVTVIVFRRSAEESVAYGHAAGGDFRSACWRAAIEMERHALAVARFAERHPGGRRRAHALKVSIVERRSLFFAAPEGYELFRERLCRAPRGGRCRPEVLFDGPLPGPWTRYADVWRVVYAPPSDAFISPTENYFLW